MFYNRENALVVQSDRKILLEVEQELNLDLDSLALERYSTI